MNPTLRAVLAVIALWAVVWFLWGDDSFFWWVAPLFFTGVTWKVFRMTNKDIQEDEERRRREAPNAYNFGP